MLDAILAILSETSDAINHRLKYKALNLRLKSGQIIAEYVHSQKHCARVVIWRPIPVFTK